MPVDTLQALYHVLRNYELYDFAVLSNTNGDLQHTTLLPAMKGASTNGGQKRFNQCFRLRSRRA
jgi:hypothetical protein